MLHGHQSAPSAGGKVQRAIASTLHLKDDGFVETAAGLKYGKISKAMLWKMHAPLSSFTALEGKQIFGM